MTTNNEDLKSEIKARIESLTQTVRWKYDDINDINRDIEVIQEAVEVLADQLDYLENTP